MPVAGNDQLRPCFPRTLQDAVVRLIGEHGQPLDGFHHARYTSHMPDGGLDVLVVPAEFFPQFAGQFGQDRHRSEKFYFTPHCPQVTDPKGSELHNSQTPCVRIDVASP